MLEPPIRARGDTAVQILWVQRRALLEYAVYSASVYLARIYSVRLGKSLLGKSLLGETRWEFLEEYT